jgi:hypothetical protein
MKPKTRKALQAGVVVEFCENPKRPRARMKPKMRKALQDMAVLKYRETSNPLSFWEFLDAMARSHFEERGREIDDKFFHAVFNDMPPEVLWYLIGCARKIEKLKKADNGTIAADGVAKALGLVVGRRNRFREWKAEQAAIETSRKDMAARKAGLKGTKREAAVAGAKVPDSRTLARNIKRGRELEAKDWERAMRSFGIPKDWRGSGGKK